MNGFLSNIINNAVVQAQSDLFIGLTVVIVIAVILGFIFKKLKQPTILAFIVTGIVLSSLVFASMDITELEGIMEIFADIGIAFLLFLVGVHLDPKVLRDIGKASIITGLGQITFTFVIAFAVATFLQFSFIEAAYISLALTFSSTIIIVKLLTDKNDLNSLYAKISIGFLLVQDFVAIMAFIFISTAGTETVLSEQILSFVVKLVLLLVIVWVFYRYLIKKVFDSFAKSQELLFLGAISWCFALASLSMILIGSKEIGAFLAGVSIASLPYSYQVFAKLKYLRDFFIVLFFVYLGSSLVFSSAKIVLVPSIIFSLIVIIGNPLIIFGLMSLLGYKSRTAFMAGTGFAQISEFSLILVFLGAKVGHISDEITSMITLVAVITISFSTYLLLYNHQIYERLFKKIPLLRKTFFYEDKLSRAEEKNYSIIFLGFGETGRKIFSQIKVPKEEVLIVDYDPRVVKEYVAKGFHCIYGDAADIETIQYVRRRNPKVVISTVMDEDTNERVVKEFKKKRSAETHLIILANTIAEAKALYAKKAEFVLVPSLAAADKIAIIFDDLKKNRKLELDWMRKAYSESTKI